MIRVAINGFVCDRETIDHVLEMDGKGDEIYFTWSVAANGSRTANTSRTYGDRNGNPGRIKAGSRSDQGGIRSGDVVPFRLGPMPGLPPGFPLQLPVPLPAWSSKAADGFPIVIWQGDVGPGDRVKIAPLIWEGDGSFANPGPAIAAANAVAVAISTALGYGAIGAAIGGAVAKIADIVGIAGNRPIGMNIAAPNPAKSDWPQIEITAQNVAMLVAQDHGFGRGVLPMMQTDPPEIGAGSYRYFVQISRV
jgi:hypothetical protein